MSMKVKHWQDPISLIAGIWLAVSPFHATRAAVEEGIVPGGGVAYLRARQALEGKLKGANPDQDAGIRIVRLALEAPLRTIAANAGEEPSVVVSKIVEGKGAYGFNAQTREFGDLVEMGIVDPAKVVRTALQNAASVAGLLITTGALVAEAPKQTDGQASPTEEMAY